MVLSYANICRVVLEKTGDMISSDQKAWNLFIECLKVVLFSLYEMQPKYSNFYSVYFEIDKVAGLKVRRMDDKEIWKMGYEI